VQTAVRNGAGAQAPRRRAGINRARRPGMQNDGAMAMMSADRRADERGGGADRTKTIVPFIAALIPARAVPAIVVPAIAAVLDCLHGRQRSERGKRAAAVDADARLGVIDD
jgi:hypothetical protein